MQVRLDVSLFNYLDRPIFDVMMNDTDLFGASAHGFYGANGVIASQKIILGAQIISWRLDGPEGTPGNGDKVMAKNTPILDSIAGEIKWLGLHIYPDNTVEVKLSKGTPGELQTPRGLAIIRAWEATR